MADKKEETEPPTYTEDVNDSGQTQAPVPDVNLKKEGEAGLSSELISAGSQELHRKLGGKEIQLFAVGGAIGTCKEFPQTLKERGFISAGNEDFRKC